MTAVPNVFYIYFPIIENQRNSFLSASHGSMYLPPNCVERNLALQSRAEALVGKIIARLKSNIYHRMV